MFWILNVFLTVMSPLGSHGALHTGWRSTHVTAGTHSDVRRVSRRSESAWGPPTSRVGQQEAGVWNPTVFDPISSQTCFELLSI